MPANESLILVLVLFKLRYVSTIRASGSEVYNHLSKDFLHRRYCEAWKKLGEQILQYRKENLID
jgi:hypothetical protein